MRRILKYETIQLLRDKKTVFFVFILPLVVFPLINGLISWGVSAQVKSISSEKFTVAVIRDGFDENILHRLESDTLITLAMKEKRSDYETLLENYPVILSSSHNDSTGLAEIILTFSSKKDKQSIQAGNLAGKLRGIRKDISEERYAEIGITDYYERIYPKTENIASPADVANARTAGFLPVTLVMILLIGTFTISNYVILGEKDNNTFELLLASGTTRTGIIYGKMAMVLSAGILMSGLSLLSFILYGKLTGAVSVGMHLDMNQTVLFIITVTGLSLVISSVTVFTSCRLRSSSSGQLAFMPLMILFLVLSLMGTFQGVEIIKGFILVPVMNSSGLIKSIITGQVSVLTVTGVALLNILYSAVIAKSSADYLGSEDILVKSHDIDIARKGFSKGAAMTAFALLVVVYMMAGGYLQQKNILIGLILSQVLIFGGFVLIMMRISGTGPKKMLFLKKADRISLLAALILGLTARYPVSLVSEKIRYLFPIPDFIQNSDTLTLAGLDSLSLPVAILVIALLPAVFEEAVFRGVFFRILENKYSKAGLIIVTGIMFGLMHLNIFNIFETAVLGMALGVLTLISGSIYPAVIMHFVNNAVSVILLNMMHNGVLGDDNFFVSSRPLAYTLSIGVCALLAWMILRSKKTVSAS